MILKDGTLSGWVEADDGSIELCHCSRSDASGKQFQNQMKDKAGVYILYSDKNIYAGRTNNLSERIRNHLNEKTFWTNVVTLGVLINVQVFLFAIGSSLENLLNYTNLLWSLIFEIGGQVFSYLLKQ